MKNQTSFPNTGDRLFPVKNRMSIRRHLYLCAVFSFCFLLPASCGTNTSNEPFETSIPQDGVEIRDMTTPLSLTQDEAEIKVESSPTGIPTPLPIDPADYDGWWRYQQENYKFAFFLPGDWIVEEITTKDPEIQGHQLNLHPRESNGGEYIRLTYRMPDESVPLWPTGVGAGQFVPGGTLQVAGLSVGRNYFVCPTGQINAIWYFGAENGTPVQLGEMEFFFLYSYLDVYCQEGYSLEGKGQHIAELIIASLTNE